MRCQPIILEALPAFAPGGLLFQAALAMGLVSEATEPSIDQKKEYEFDPHIDHQLQWAGKAEHTSFEVPTVSLHVHERIDPKTILDNARGKDTGPRQPSLFETGTKPLREAIEFYKHRQGWSNRLIAGDSLLVMNSLLEKEGMAGKVQMAVNNHGGFGEWLEAISYHPNDLEKILVVAAGTGK